MASLLIGDRLGLLPGLLLALSVGTDYRDQMSVTMVR